MALQESLDYINNKPQMPASAPSYEYNDHEANYQEEKVIHQPQYDEHQGYDENQGYDHSQNNN